MKKIQFFSLVLILFIFLGLFIPALQSQTQQPVYLIFVWHYHQPWYYSVNGSYFILPWVRMHSVGNYYKMAYILSKYPDIKATFDFSGSLLVQIQDYLSGKEDIRQILSWKVANGSSLTVDDKFSILQIPNGFFDINWNRIVNVVPEYKELRDKVQNLLQQYGNLPEDQLKQKVVSSFTDQDFINLVALFNLFWMDPLVLKEQYPALYQLRQEVLNSNYNFTRSDIANILNAQMDIMRKLLPIYKNLLESGQAEIIPVPYSHPLAPLLEDFGFHEDMFIQINKSIQIFQNVFNITPKGIWPAEQAINDRVLEDFANFNFTWTITDQTLLSKMNMDPNNDFLKIWYSTFNSKRIYVLFRNDELSNAISFSYSNMNAQDAVNNIINVVLQYASKPIANPVIVIALDGENPWENYMNFGDDFLNTLYSTLENYQKQNRIITITPSEYIEKFNPSNPLSKGDREYFNLSNVDISDLPISYTQDGYDLLPKKEVQAYMAEGSWASGELAMWIGQRQENAAWMLLKKAREDLFSYLHVSSLNKAMNLNPQAMENLLRAEASDWFWWYGGDGGGSFPANPLFKGYLRGIYGALNVQNPSYLLVNFNPEATPIGTINNQVPIPLKSKPTIDGIIENNEWNGALNLTLGDGINNILIALDQDNLYIAVLPQNASILNNLTIGIYLTNPWRSVSPYHIQYNTFPRFEEKDLGMGLFYEILIFPGNDTILVNIADGKGGWINLFHVTDFAINQSIEASIPWNFLNLRAGDIVYVTAAVYEGNSIISYATKLGLTYYFQVPLPVVTTSGKMIFDMKDPEGDDNGAGTYVYPKDSVFQKGVFDLLEFQVIDNGDSLLFKSFFKNLGGNPWNGPNGFSLQYIQIYIHTTLNITGRRDTFGLNVNISDDSAWHLAILVTPGWGSDPVPKGERSAIYYYNDTVVVQDDRFKVYAIPSENSIVAEISKTLLLDLNNTDKWKYVVVVTSYDGYGPDRIRNFGVDAQQWVVGVGAKYATAILNNVIPRIMDLLAPSSDDQYSQLNSFIVNTTANIVKPAVLHGVSKATTSSVTTSTVISTTTITSTTTIQGTSATNVYGATPLQIAGFVLAFIIGFSIAFLINVFRKKSKI